MLGITHYREPCKCAVTPQIYRPTTPLSAPRLSRTSPGIFPLQTSSFRLALPLHHQPLRHHHTKPKQPWPTDETGSPAVEATDPTMTTETNGATGTGRETATTPAGATTARATRAGTGTETGTGTPGGTARAPETEATAGARDLPAASGATTGAMGIGTAASGGGKTVGSHSGSAETGA
jgi:hypothetical protein